MFILIGLAVLAGGVFMVIKSEVMLRSFGRIEFFERYLGTEGGSRLGYKLVGLIVIFVGFLIMTNMVNNFLGWILAPLLNVMKPM